MTYDFKNVTVLVVEDNKPMIDLTESILKTFGVGYVYTAQDGREAYKIFCREIPDIVITDLVMTPIDGIELAQMIRQNPKSPDPYVPIILITAFSEKERVIEARDNGVTEFLLKPFNARDLYRRIAQVIENPRKFVKTEEFFGPDRRRKSKSQYKGPLKRKTDVMSQDYENWRTRLMIQSHGESTKE
ncbi:MAG: response regulator [Pseudomonadota bacterium]